MLKKTILLVLVLGILLPAVMSFSSEQAIIVIGGNGDDIFLHWMIASNFNFTVPEVEEPEPEPDTGGGGGGGAAFPNQVLVLTPSSQNVTIFERKDLSFEVGNSFDRSAFITLAIDTVNSDRRFVDQIEFDKDIGLSFPLQGTVAGRIQFVEVPFEVFLAPDVPAGEYKVVLLVKRGIFETANHTVYLTVKDREIIDVVQDTVFEDVLDLPLLNLGIPEECKDEFGIHCSKEEIEERSTTIRLWHLIAAMFALIVLIVLAITLYFKSKGKVILEE